ncbi:hypothetical protein Tco_1340948 [Tanacetum coccineum]
MFVKINTYKDSYKFGDVARQRPPIAVINVTPRVMVLPLNSSSHSPGFAEIFLQLLGKPKRKDTQIPQFSGPTKHVADEAVYKELDDSLVRAATTASSLEAEQDIGGGPRSQETMGDTTARTRRVKRLEKKKRPRTHGLKRLYKVGLSTRVESSIDEESLGEDASKQERINAIDTDEDITLVNDQDDVDMFEVNTLTGDEVLAELEVDVKDVNLSVDEVTLAQALAALKSLKVQEKGDVIEEPSVPVSTVSASTKDNVATTITAIIPTLRKGIVFQESGTITTTTTISSQQPSQTNV